MDTRFGFVTSVALLTLINFINSNSAVVVLHGETYATWGLPGGSFIMEDGSGCHCFTKYWEEIPIVKCIRDLGKNPCKSAKMVPFRQLSKRAYSHFYEPLGCVCLNRQMYAIPMRNCYDKSGMLMC